MKFVDDDDVDDSLSLCDRIAARALSCFDIVVAVAVAVAYTHGTIQNSHRSASLWPNKRV